VLKMSRLTAAILGTAIILPATAHAGCVESYWIPFGAELYTPESEASIKSRAFEKNSMSVFIAESLSPKNPATDQEKSYNPQNVRAVILLPGAETYIDRFGWTRQGNAYGKVDVIEVEKQLSTPCFNK
jgi:hypothetical protein